MKIDHRQVAANGLQFHVATAGSSDGPLVMLLHGFPEFWYGWRHQFEPLAEAGFWVWAPDQRGYNLSDKPRGVEAYAIGRLAEDVAALIEAAGRRQAIVVGHDWGGAVAWHLAANFPERVERAFILNVPHPAVMMRELRRNPRQLWRSWYMFFFQIPWLPERCLAFDHGWYLARSLRRTSRPGAFSEDDLQRYREAWSQPGALTGMLHWYRAAMRRTSSRSPDAPIRAPTLLVWGAHDRFLGREMAGPSVDRCEDGKLVFIEEATHWVQHEEPARVNQLLLHFALNGMDH
jgi:epoxide hydrolase 4